MEVGCLRYMKRWHVTCSGPDCPGGIAKWSGNKLWKWTYSQMTSMSAIKQETGKQPWQPGLLKHYLEYHNGNGPKWRQNRLVNVKYFMKQDNHKIISFSLIAHTYSHVWMAKSLWAQDPASPCGQPKRTKYHGQFPVNSEGKTLASCQSETIMFCVKKIISGTNSFYVINHK